ncbi:MAG: phage portal protein [Pleurocapsa sp. SU_5_0]|nr:phage portal protein [Pleurocapsa sp. SU_5_0]NJO98543.1 phage portal protein [Pleurocapsa sp. CRU_1_2]NJR46345.1 phage portal protein [Hyellaceae cyanobacterium CSU_1_1]
MRQSPKTALVRFVRNIWNTPPRHSINHKTRRYDGARRGRNYGGWMSTQNSANADIWTDLTTLRGRSRDLCRNNDYARGVIGKLVDNVVYQGIGFQAQVKQIKDPGKNDDRVNSLIETAWKSWAEEKMWCHTAGKLDFYSLQQLAFRSVLESGEVFIRKVKQSFSLSPIPFALEVIEADQCSEDHNQTYGGNQIVMGIEVDKWQRPVAYWFYKQHPGDLWQGRGGVVSRELERVPASEIIHLHFSDRPNQLRGLPILYSTLCRMKNVGDYEESEQLAAKLAACVMGIVTTPDADLLGEPGQDDGALPADEKFEPGVIRYQASGEKFDLLDPTRPNPNLVAFIEAQLRASGAGIGASYETISNDYSKSNYSSSRLSLITARDRYKVLQTWFVCNFNREVLLGNPESDGWLDLAVLSGVLNFPDYELRPKRYAAIKWQCRGWSWVDPHKEVQATLASLAGGMTSLTKFYAEQGEDFEESVKTIARERAFLEENGILVNFGSLQVQEEEDQSST